MTADTQTGAEELGGPAAFLLPVTLIGVLAGLGLYANFELIGDERDILQAGLAIFTVAFAGSLTALVRSGRWIAGGAAALFIGAAVALSFTRMIDLNESWTQLDEAPFYFWFAGGGALAGYLLLVFAKSTIDGAFPPRYDAIFLNGLSLPLIGAAALVIAMLITALFLCWAWAFDLLGIDFFLELIGEPWFALPFFGGVGALSVAMIRGRTAILGALRFLILFLARIAAPLYAAFAATLAVTLVVSGADAIFERDGLAPLMLSLSLAGMLIFNGVYQNGEGAAPPLWLRGSSLVILILAPAFVALSVLALWMRIDQYGLTPARFLGFSVALLIAVYSLFGFIGALSEINWGARRWMRPIAPLNTLTAVIWIVVLFGFVTPLLDPWAWSARQQAKRLESGAVAIDGFDFGYLYFRLGPVGESEARRLATIPGRDDHWELRRRLDLAENVEGYWAYKEAMDSPAIADDEDAFSEEPVADTEPAVEEDADAAGEESAEASPDEATDPASTDASAEAPIAFPSPDEEPEPSEG